MSNCLQQEYRERPSQALCLICECPTRSDDGICLSCGDYADLGGDEEPDFYEVEPEWIGGEHAALYHGDTWRDDL